MTELGTRERDAILVAIRRATLTMKAATPLGGFEAAMTRLGRLLHELERRYNPNWPSQLRVSQGATPTVGSGQTAAQTVARHSKRQSLRGRRFLATRYLGQRCLTRHGRMLLYFALRPILRQNVKNSTSAIPSSAR